MDILERIDMMIESDYVSMTYGVIPKWKDFEKKFKKYVGKSYNYVLKGTDASTAKKVGIPVRGDFSAKELYDIVMKLTDAWENGDDNAGDLASGILTTLEFEWI